MTQPTPASPTDIVAAAVTKLLKPGSKTSEFVALVAIYGGSLATLLGTFNTANPRFNAVLKIAALAAAAAGQISYALSRGNVKTALADLAAVVARTPVEPAANTGSGPAVPAIPADGGAVDLVGLVAGVLTVAGMIWLIIGITHHALDVFGLVLLLVGLGIFVLFGGGVHGASWRRRP